MKKIPFILAIILSVVFLVPNTGAAPFYVGNENKIEEKPSATESKKCNVSIRPFVSVPKESMNIYNELTSDIIINVLDPVEGFGSDYAPWFWSEETFSILDNYAPFIFRTKKSSAFTENLRVILSINEFGKIIEFKILNESADRGLKERVAYVIRKIPPAVPVPGFNSYQPMDFELVMGY